MIPATRTIHVPHLGGIDVGYAVSGETIDPQKPTFVMINSMCMTAALYEPQFSNPALTAAANLVAIEPLGHGATSLPPRSDHFTYWDSAVAALQAADAVLGAGCALYALGTSQGAWIATRMALLAPEKALQIRGLVLLGTSLDHDDSAAARAHGCWAPAPLLAPFLDRWARSCPDFVVDDTWCGMVTSLGFGSKPTATATATATTAAAAAAADTQLRVFWTRTLRATYRGDEGRRKIRMALLNLLTRDGLLPRLCDVRCPVRWLQGTEDVPFGTTAPAAQIELFTSAPTAELTLVDGGSHYLNATNPGQVADAMLRMVSARGA